MFCICCCGGSVVTAQVTSILQAPVDDTSRLIQILRGNSLREKYIDTISFQTIAGDVQLREALTLFNCDSAAINKTTNIMEAFGNIHINQQDSIHTYAQYLKYIGKERMAYLKKGVRLTDKKGTLYTDDLEYNMTTNIGNYKNGGRVVNGKTTLTSIEGTYYADTRDVYFKRNVKLKDPKYDITTDSLLYNTQTQVVTFITMTHIVSKDGGDIYTSSGTYDLKNGKAYFGNRSVFKDSTRIYVADNIALDEKTQTAQLEGNAVIRDSVNGYTVLGGQIFANQNNKTFLATRKPVLIFKGEGNDSTYVAADTLFSGMIIKDSTGERKLLPTDTLTQTTIVSRDSVAVNVPDSNAIKNKTDSTGERKLLPPDTLTQTAIVQKDTIATGSLDSTGIKNKTDSSTIDPVISKAVDTVKKADNAVIKIAEPITKAIDSTGIAVAQQPVVTAPLKKRTDSAVVKPGLPPVLDTTLVEPDAASTDTLNNSSLPVQDSSFNLSKDTAIRYFQAFHHVRIYNDSVQAVCDSLFYSSQDSTFRMFKDPLVFSSKSQIAGDTIFLFTKNKKASRVYVFEKGIIINEVNKQMYNQVAGRTLNGYFKYGQLDYMRVKGSPAESIFYPQDDDSAITGMNRCHGDVIDIYFVNKEVNKVKFVNDVTGALYPLYQIPEDQKKLPLFNWQDARRPKNKLELFE
jgi:OstA-like protein